MAAPRITVEYRDGTTRELRVGLFAQIATKKRYGQEALASGDIEAASYAMWVEINGPPTKNGASDQDFEDWVFTVVDAYFPKALTDDVDPTTADPSDTPLASPPTSESTPSD